jgi:hypothetical protein
VRWTTGFLLNLRDYRDLIFSRKHGQIGSFTLPAGVISLITVIFFAGYAIVNAASTMSDRIVQYRLIGIQWHWPSFQWFFVDTTVIRMLSLMLVILAITFIFFGKRISHGSWKLSRDMIYYAFLYGFLAPIWVSISWYRALIGNVGSWR